VNGDLPPTRVIARAAIVALALGLAVAFVLSPASGSGAVRAVELVAVVLLGLVAVAAVVATVTAWLGAGEDSPEFEQLVQRSERIAAGADADADAADDVDELDPLRDDDFEELVRDALDELPDLLRNALDHVAVVISDGGRAVHAYGLYEGYAGRRGGGPDRIVIFRDTLRRDFGHDARLLRAQVVRTVRHELAHHVGFDEMGVSGLGL
jgi:predicted Zn-dependent protease with MMP-like domain